MKLTEKLGAKLISDITVESQLGWPPSCFGLIYQPERPITDRQLTEDDQQNPEDLDK